MNLNKRGRVIGIITVAVIVIAAIVITIVLIKRNSMDTGITYYTENGTMFAREEITDGKANIPNKALPDKSGRVFAGWDRDITVIDKKASVTAQYLDVSNEDNAVTLPTAYIKMGETIDLPLKILGKVDLCATDLIISYDTELLEYVSNDKTDSEVAIDSDAEAELIYIRFVSGENVNAELDLTTLRFKAKSSEKADTAVKISVVEMVKQDGDNFAEVPFKTFDGTVHIF